MALTNVKAAITQPQFPFNTSNFVDTVLRDVGFEQERMVEGFENQPQAYFMQNVLPVARGYTSVHFARTVGDSTYPVYMDKVLQLRDSSGEVALLAPCGGQNLIYSAATGSWVSHAFLSPFTGAVTVAYLKGKTYVCYEGLGLYSYDFGTQTFAAETLSGGITFTDIIGVAAAGVYLILYTSEYVAYSSPLDPLDFTAPPGGQSAILANRGTITTVLPISNGIIVHTTVNAVYGKLTNNANFPFTFAEIPNSAGVSDSEHVTYDSTNDVHVAWTTSGLMFVSTQRAEPVWAELSDMLAANQYPVAGAAVNAYHPRMSKKQELAVKVSSVGSRYIAISCKDASSGVAEYPVAFIYDIALKRWGRIDIPHVDVFEYRAPEFSRAWVYDELMDVYDNYPEVYDDLQEAIVGQAARFGTTFGVIGKLGAVHVALTADYTNVQLMESASSAATPLILFGKYRIVRRQSVMFSRCDVAEMFDATVTFLAHSMRGKPLRKIDLTESLREEGAYYGRMHGSAVSILIRGRFTLSSLQFSCEGQGSNLHPTATASTIPEDVIVVDDVPVTVDEEYAVL